MVSTCSRAMTARAAGVSNEHVNAVVRRRVRSVGVAACLALVAVMLPLGRVSGFSAGEPIELEVTPGDTLEVPFEGINTGGLAVSFMQCTGDEYLSMSLSYNGTLLSSSTLSSNECNRLIASGTTADEDEVSLDQLCAFRTSAAVRQGYTEKSVVVNATSFVSPGYVTVIMQNKGDIPASGELVMFTADRPAPNVDDTIDRVNTIAELDENTYTVTVDFQASANDDLSLCSSSSGCALYAYYLEVNDGIPNAEVNFGTTCQSEMGTLMYDEIITTESTATLATAAFTVRACLQFPAQVQAEYRVFLIVSPDTTSYSRVGFGLEDQLIFASPVLSVRGDADVTCPEEVEETAAAGAVGRIVPARATGAIALSLAAAATARGAGIMEL